MSRPLAADCVHEDPIMPPLIYETVAWLRHYSAIPFPPLPGESEAGILPDPARAAYAAPVAGGVIGAAAGLVIVVVAALGASHFVAASAGVLALIVITGGRAEAAVEGLAARETATVIRYGILAIAVAVLLRASALDALLFRDPSGVLFVLAGACAMARAAAIGFALLRPASPEAVAADRTTLQWLAIAGLGLGVITVLPFYGLGAAVAGIAAAAGAVALVSAFVSRGANGTDNFAATAELAAEIAFLIAVAAFTDNP